MGSTGEAGKIVFVRGDGLGGTSVGYPSGTELSEFRFSSGSGGGSYTFYINNGVNVAERFRINYTGNVGIGTTAPSARLQIGGVAGTDGIAYPDATVQTTAFIVASGQAWRTTAYSVSSAGTWYNLPLDAGDGSLTNATHSTFTNPERITVSVGGTYAITYSLNFFIGSAAHHSSGRLVKNGATEIAGSYFVSCVCADANDNRVVERTVITSLAANDYVNIQVGSNVANITNFLAFYSSSPAPTSGTLATLAVRRIGP